MKMKFLIALVSFCLCNVLSGQIKIGDNPQNIDASSVLELESSNRALVITRINTQQMNTIVPLQGAIIYNTDEQCLYFYDGASWLNMCETFGLTFTADPIINPTPTIVITETGDNRNFEVGEITGANIVDFSISGNDIQNNSINSDKLAPDSVGSEELQDNTVADAEIDYNQVTLNDFNNDAGFITGAEIVSPAPNNAITDNGGAFYDDTPLQNDIAANAAAIAADGDTDAANELITAIVVQGDDLVINEGTNQQTVSLADFNNTGSDNQTLALNNTTDELSILNGNSVDLSGYLDNTDEQQLSIAGDQLSLTDGGTVTIPTADGSDTQITQGTDILITGIGTIGDPYVINNAFAEVDGSTTNETITTAILNGANELIITEAGTDFTVDLNGLSTGGTQDLNSVLTQGNDGGGAFIIKSILDPVDPQDAATKGYVDNQVASGSIISNNLSVTGGANALFGNVTIDIPDDAINAAMLNIDVAGAGILQNAISGALEIEPSATNGQFLSTDAGGNVAWVDLPPSAVNQNLTEVLTLGNDAGAFRIENLLDPVDPQDAATQNYVEARIATILGAGGADGVVSNAVLSGTEIDFTGTNSGFNGSVDLNPVFATDAELAALPINDADADPANEIQTLSILGADLTLSNGGGTVSVPSSADGVVSNITTTGTSLDITGANGGFNGTVDLEPLVDAAAANNGFLTAEVDGDINNEIQAISILGNDLTLSNGGGTITLPSGAADGVVSNITTTGTSLDITGANGGFNGTVDLEPLVDAAVANNGFLTAEVDGDINNEIQNITSSDGSLIIMNPGINFDLLLNTDFGGKNISNIGNLQINGTMTVVATQVHPDYVFEKYFNGQSRLNKSYNFISLKEVESFVKKYHHLPGIKSAKEVQKDGVWNLSESNLQNLEKIEELFLHTINQEKEINQLKTKNESLSTELELLRKDLGEIKELLKNVKKD